jgi:multimeric flavodoxin WrbA
VEDDFQQIFSAWPKPTAFCSVRPVYHSSVTPELKALLDRAGFSGRWAVNEMQQKSDSYEWKGSVFSGKVVAPVTVARRAGQNFAFAQLLLWAACNDCIMVGNTYWNMGVAGKGGAVDAEDDKEGIDIMKGLARRMVGTIEALSHKKE